MNIHNILYPRLYARDDEVERMDGAALDEGRVIIGRVHRRLTRYPPQPLPEYTVQGQQCTSVTYRWLMLPSKED